MKSFWALLHDQILIFVFSTFWLFKNLISDFRDLLWHKNVTFRDIFGIFGTFCDGHKNMIILRHKYTMIHNSIYNYKILFSLWFSKENLLIMFQVVLFVGKLQVLRHLVYQTPSIPTTCHHPNYKKHKLIFLLIRDCRTSWLPHHINSPRKLQ